MSIVNYSSTSQYYNTSQTSWCLNLLEYRNISQDPSDTIISLISKYKNNPYLLSYDYYGTDRLWWIFMIVNPDTIIDPINDMVPGMEIRIPTSTRLKSELGIS